MAEEGSPEALQEMWRNGLEERSVRLKIKCPPVLTMVALRGQGEDGPYDGSRGLLRDDKSQPYRNLNSAEA